MQFKLIYSIILTLGLASCATPIESLKHEYNQAEITSTTLQNLSYKLIEPLTKLTDTVSTKSPVYEFEGEKSFFNLYKLPQINGKYLINVQTLGVDFDWGPNGKWFYPILDFYDKEFINIATVAMNLPVLRPRKDISSLGFDAATTILEANYIVDTDATKPIYLAVRTSSKLFDYGVALNTRSSASAYYINGNVTYIPSDGSTSTYANPFSPFGKYEIIVVPEGERVEQLETRYQTSARIVCLKQDPCNFKKATNYANTTEAIKSLH